MKLTIKGGTIVSASPPFDTYTNVMLPALQKMGADIKLDLKHHGLFPDVVGELSLTVKALEEPLKVIDWTERGDLKSVDVYVTLTDGEMKDTYQEKIKHQFEEEFKAQMPSNVTLNMFDTKTIDKPPKAKA